MVFQPKRVVMFWIISLSWADHKKMASFELCVVSILWFLLCWK